MLLSKKTRKTAKIFSIVWGILIAVFLAATFFPKIFLSVGLAVALVFLLFNTWKLAETFSHD